MLTSNVLFIFSKGRLFTIFQKEPLGIQCLFLFSCCILFILTIAKLQCVLHFTHLTYLHCYCNVECISRHGVQIHLWTHECREFDLAIFTELCFRGGVNHTVEFSPGQHSKNVPLVPSHITIYLLPGCKETKERRLESKQRRMVGTRM